MNFHEMCRTCLRSGEVMSSIFDEEIEPTKHTAADLLALFTSVQVDKEDCFPHKICDICLKEIQQVYLFDLKCKKSEIILHQLREIRVNVKKLSEIPKQKEIVGEGIGELENIIKKDFKQEDIMNLCDRDISNPESKASDRIRSIEEENANASEKLNLQIVEEDCTRDFQLAFKREPEHSNHFMKDDKNEKELERTKILSNIGAENCDPEFQITLKQEPDHDSPIRNNAGQNELELNQNSSNFEILDECGLEDQVIFKTDPDQNNLVMKDIENEGELEFSEISSNVQIVEDECAADFRVNFKTEPELDIGIDCNCAELKCSVCLKQFQSLDMFRGHIVSDHLEENVCKLCKEEFECSQFEHSAKHFPLDYDENMKIEQNEKFRHGETTTTGHKKAIQNAEFFDKPDCQCKICSKSFVSTNRLVNHMRTHTDEKPFECELCQKKFENKSALLYHKRTKHTDEFNCDDKPVPDFQCSVCNKVFGQKYALRDHMREHTGESPFQCGLCPEKFRRNYTLLCHRRTKHTDEFISDDKQISDFQCSVCYKVFGHKFRLREHMRTHTGEKPFQCKLCPEKFRKNDALLCHSRTKHTDELISGDKPVPDFQCSVCYKVFGNNYRLKEHMRTHTGEKPFDCELCPQKFRSRKGLLYHRQTKHTDELVSDDNPVSDFQCRVCYKVFFPKFRLKEHMYTHTGEKPFDCEFCPEKFGSSNGLLCHRRTKHTDKFISDDKPVPDFQCSVCYKVFGNKFRLREHMRTHTGEKPFQCKLCPEKFRKNDALLFHSRTKHTDKLISDDKPVPDFQCSVCYKVFGNKFRLREHMRTHTGEKPFQCKLCPEKFKKNHGLLCHRRTKHTAEFISDDKPVPDFQCSVCYKVFGNKFRLREHMCSHTGEKPFQCKFCPEKFRKNAALLSHNRTKHTDELISDDKPVSDFQCSICYKVFAHKFRLRDHMHTHTGEKPFDCELCREKFRNSSTLLWHRRTKHTEEFISDDKPLPDFQCSVCNKVFGRKYILRDHMRIHTGEKPFECILCPEKFRRNTDLLCHKRAKHSDEFISDNKSVPDL